MVFSQSTLRRDGGAWFRFWAGGPGVAVRRSNLELFSTRNGFVRCLRIGGLTFTWLKASR